MTDPLRPFADAIRTLWRTRAQNAQKTQDKGTSGAASAGISQPQPGRTRESLRARLKARISVLDPSAPSKLRETFVETVLLWELGEQLAPDPGFADLVARVSEQLVSDPQTGERLHRLLLEIGGFCAQRPGAAKPDTRG
ncbi:MAG TPA: hypothetical protein VGM84_07030 [Steroidobacteraceae bacterium]|jgi:hypothetical protein